MELGGWVVRRLIEELFKKLHTMLAGRKGYPAPELASVAHRTLGIFRGIAKRGRKPTKNSALVRRAKESGLSSAFHLSAAFKKAYGMSPDAWRKPLSSGPGRGKGKHFQGSFWEKKNAGGLSTTRVSLKGNSLGLEVDLDRERFLLSVLLVVLIFTFTTATGAFALGEDGVDGESGENRREEE